MDLKIAADGRLLNSGGGAVLGYPTTPDGKVSGSLGELWIPPELAPRPTTWIRSSLRLIFNSDSPAAFSVTNPYGTSSFMIETNVWDSRGEPHPIQLFLRHAGPREWDWHLLADGAQITGGTAGTSVEVSTGMLAFDGSGLSPATTQASGPYSFKNSEPQSIAIDFGAPPADGGTVEGAFEGPFPFEVTRIEVDGSAAAARVNATVDADGVLSASYANGTVTHPGRLAFTETELGVVRVGPAGGSPDAVGCGLTEPATFDGNHTARTR